MLFRQRINLDGLLKIKESMMPHLAQSSQETINMRNKDMRQNNIL